MVKKRKVVPIKVTSDTLCALSVYSEFNRNSMEIGLCVQFFAQLLSNTAIFADDRTPTRNPSVINRDFSLTEVTLIRKI